MAVSLSASGRLRRLVLLSAIAITIFYLLRTPSQRYTQYLGYQSPESPPEIDRPISENASPPAIADNIEGLYPELDDHQTSPQEAAPLPDPPELSSPPIEKLPLDTDTPRARIPPELQEILAWDPPKPEHPESHYPPYSEYAERDYDPNRWEGFEQNTAFFLNGTVESIPDLDQRRPRYYIPYPDYNSEAWRSRWLGDFAHCDSARGKPFNISAPDLVSSRRNDGSGFPAPDVGSFEAIGLDASICFDRYSKLSPYGLHPVRPAEDWRVDWQRVRWGQLQGDCLQRNANRFAQSSMPNLRTGISSPEDTRPYEDPVETQWVAERTFRSRTAVLIRTWGDYEYHDNDVQAIRALVTELSLLSGGEYQVFLFVNIKDKTKPIFEDPAEYQRMLESTVPDEFRDMAILWNENIGQSWYTNLSERDLEVYWSQFMPVQWFSKLHPEFDYVWNWEMDVRHIGQTYHFLEKVGEFARKQPRKYLWERNSRFYFPSVHGSWETFVQDTNEVTAASPYIQSVWGPQPWTVNQTTVGPTPPVKEEDDNFEWGVGEDADFITFLPIWNPIDTDWSYREKVFNYPDLPKEQRRKPFAHIPRRTYINTMVRLSKRLLHAMHLENHQGYSMASEMWPSSVALQHGLKAVYAPHPIWFSHDWPASYLDPVFNADGWSAGSIGTLNKGHGIAWDSDKAERQQPQNGSGPTREGALGRWSAQRDAVYSPDREHNFGVFSWYFWSDFPKVIYLRWLGWKAHLNPDALGDVGDRAWEDAHGRLCLPSMLLHPVKKVKSSSGDLGSPVDAQPPTWPIATEGEIFAPPAGRVDTNQYYADFNSPRVHPPGPRL